MQAAIGANQEESTCISVAIIREMAAGVGTAESYHPLWTNCKRFCKEPLNAWGFARFPIVLVGLLLTFPSNYPLPVTFTAGRLSCVRTPAARGATPGVALGDLRPWTCLIWGRVWAHKGECEANITFLMRTWGYLWH